jgi:hypothetical protein
MNFKALVLVLLALGVAFAGLSVDGYTITKQIFSPDEPGVATVTVSNPIGSERVTSIGLTVDNPSELLVTSAPRMSDIDAGGSTIVSIPFRVKKDAAPGIYLLDVVFSGYKAVGDTQQYTTNSVSIPVTVVNEPDLSLSMDKMVLSGIDDVVLTVSNNGGPAKNANLRTEGNVSLYGSDIIYLGDMNGTKTIKLALDSRGAADGPTDVLFVFNYKDELGMEQTYNSSLRLTVRSEKLDLKFDQKSELITKKESTLAFSVRNDGTETLRDVRLSFPNDTLRLKDSGEMKFGDIAPGQSATASVIAFAELPPGVNQVNAELAWIERDVQKLESRQLPITITSDADVGVYLEAKPLPLTMGAQHTISVLVSNLGSYRIDNVDVSIDSPAMRSMDISEKQYIGSLQNDDFSTVQFLVEVNSTSAGQQPVRIIVNYRDQSGEWKSKVITQNVSVFATPSSDANPLPILGVLAIVLIGVWFLFLRKKNPNKG